MSLERLERFVSELHSYMTYEFNKLSQQLRDLEDKIDQIKGEDE